MNKQSGKKPPEGAFLIYLVLSRKDDVPIRIGLYRYLILVTILITSDLLAIFRKGWLVLGRYCSRFLHAYYALAKVANFGKLNKSTSNKIEAGSPARANKLEYQMS